MERDLGLVRRRLCSTGLAVPSAPNASEAVRRLGCAQGQDLPGVIASLAMRVPGGSAAEVTSAMTAGELVRGYPMRGTVFAVHADELAWMGELLRPTFTAELARRRASQGVSEEEVSHVRALALAALEGPARATIDARPEPSLGLTRAQLAAVWSEAGIDITSSRTYHFISTMMIEGHLAYGPWYAWAREQRIVTAASWLPGDSGLETRFGGDRIAAIAEWLRRYLVSHGPATLRDFAWCTKLGLAEIRKAAPSATAGLVELEVDGEPAWMSVEAFEACVAGEPAHRRAGRAILLPGFDELVLGTRDRGFLLTPEEHAAAVPGNNGVFRGLALDGARPVGTWRRGGAGARRRFELTPFDPARPISQRATAAFERAFAEHPWLAA